MDQEKNDNLLFSGIATTGTTPVIPLEMRWEPKEDITTYELAKCLPYIFRAGRVMPFEIDQNEPYLRHFVIVDHNKKN